MGDFSRIALDMIRENKLERLRVLVRQSDFDVNRIYPVNNDATRNTNLLQQACEVPYTGSIRFIDSERYLPRDNPTDLFEIIRSRYNYMTREIVESTTTVVKALLNHGADPSCPGLPTPTLFEIVKSVSNRRWDEMDKLTAVVKDYSIMVQTCIIPGEW